MQSKPVVSRAKAYLKARQKNVRDALKQLKLDGLLLTHPADLAYLTNFTGEDSIGLITEKEIHLVTDFRYQEQASIEAGWLKVTVRDGKMSDALAQTVLAAGVTRVGFRMLASGSDSFRSRDDFWAAIERDSEAPRSGSPKSGIWGQSRGATGLIQDCIGVRVTAQLV